MQYFRLLSYIVVIVVTSTKHTIGQEISSFWRMPWRGLHVFHVTNWKHAATVEEAVYRQGYAPKRVHPVMPMAIYPPPAHDWDKDRWD